MDIEFFNNKLTQVREHLGPFRARLEEATRTAPTEELRKIAHDLLQSLSKSYDDSAAEIRGMVNNYNAENEKVQQAKRDLEAATAAAQQRQQAAAAAAVAPKATPPFAFDPALLERLKQQLIEHVGIVAPHTPKREASAGGHHFSDWVNESLASQLAASSKRNDLTAANEQSTTGIAGINAVSRFDSWLNESIADASGTTTPTQASPADSAKDQREWEKLLGG